MSESILYEVSDRVASITITRPDARNALSPDVVSELVALLHRADKDAQVKSILLQGAGEHFCAGGDVKSFLETVHNPVEQRYETFDQRLRMGNRLPETLMALNKPLVVAALGAVAGAGVTLCLAADFTFAGPSTYFVVAHLHLGLSIDCGLSSLLVSAMGIKQAKRIVLLGEKIRAEDAVKWGIASDLVEDAQVKDAARQMALRLARGPSAAMAATKSLINQAAHGNFIEQLAREGHAATHCAASDDFRKGVEAVVNRTRPDFD